MTPPSLTRSFRQIPPAIYLALAINVASSVGVTIASLLASGDETGRFLAMRRWYMLDAGCDVASTILLALGLLELARRYGGRQRLLTQIAAYLSLASLAWIVLQPLTAIFDPRFEHQQALYDWVGRGTSVSLLASAVLLTLGADAWRRAPAAAALLVALAATSYGVPVIGKLIAEAVVSDPTTRQIYGLARVGLYVLAMLLMATTLAAGGLTPAPEPRVAARGLWLARGVLIFRIVAAIVISAMLVGGRSPNMAKIVMFAGPAVMVVTMLVFAVALLRAAGAGVEGLPRLMLTLGAAITLWWGTVQLQQVAMLIHLLRDSFLGREAMEQAEWFSIAGPIAMTIGLALVGSAIAGFARSRGDDELRDAATTRTTAFLLITLASIGLQTQLIKATSIGSAIALILLAAIAAIVALGVLTGLLARAAVALEAEPGIPPARVV